MANILKYIIVLLIAFVLNFVFHIPEELYYKTPDFIKKDGYPVETHSVDTEDGHTLYIHRIPRGQNSTSTFAHRPPVLLMAGLGLNSDFWVLAGPENNLVYLLADSGYDVWLGNIRGSVYSYSHGKPLNIYNSFHHFGIYDTPAIIDYVLNVTSEEQLSYIGYSMGTTNLFVLTSLRPEYNRKIGIFIGLATVTFPQQVSAHGREFYKLVNSTKEYHKYMDFLTQSWWRSTLFGFYCSVADCSQPFRSFGGTYRMTNKTLKAVALSHFGCGHIYGGIKHYVDSSDAKTFQWPDYGEVQNLEIYNSEKPPAYNLQNVQIPAIMFYADKDNLISKEDAEILERTLPNVLLSMTLPITPLGHNDLIWGKVDYKFLLPYLPLPG